MTSRDLLRSSTAQLAAAGVEEPAREARLLLRLAAAGQASLAVPGAADVMPEDVQRRFEDAVARRQAREPFAYIAGEREFYGLAFQVGPAVLIPRPETELLVAEALAFLDGRAAEVVDMGTGSGCIAVAVAVHAPEARVWAVDLSESALEVCAGNAARHGVGKRVVPVAGDMWRAGLPGELAGRLDAVLSNPPYVSAVEWAALAPEVRIHEPRQALVPDGGDPYTPLAEGARRWLRPGGLLACEVGQGQAEAVTDVLRRAGFRDARSFPDLAGVPRVVRGVRA